jgi:hypothetical protein
VVGRRAYNQIVLQSKKYFYSVDSVVSVRNVLTEKRLFKQQSSTSLLMSIEVIAPLDPINEPPIGSHLLSLYSISLIFLSEK